MSLDGGLELGGFVAHDGDVAGGDEVAGEALDGFGVVDFDEGEGIGGASGQIADFGLAFGFEGFGAPGDEVGAEDGNGQIDVVEEAIGPAGEAIGDGTAGGVAGRDGLEADDLEVELVG